MHPRALQQKNPPSFRVLRHNAAEQLGSTGVTAIRQARVRPETLEVAHYRLLQVGCSMAVAQPITVFFPNP